MEIKNNKGMEFNMKKRLFLLFFVFVILISGCNNKANNNEINEFIEQNPLNEQLSIYNIDEKLINQFNVFGSIHLTNDSFIYSKIPDGQIDEITSIDGEVNKTEYYSNDDERYYITYMLRAGNDNILITMDYEDPNTGEKLPKKIYYLNLSDLEFQN